MKKNCKECESVVYILKKILGRFLHNNSYKNISNGIVHLEENKILADYAIKHNARNVQAYINTLKSSGSAKKIISESKKKRNYTQIALRSIEETQNLIKQYKDFEQSAVSPQTCAAWVNFGKSLGY